jgi:HK97 family phage major capsid protein
VPVNTFKFGSKIITVPIELLQDAQFDIAGMVMKRMRDRIGRIQNQKFTIGVGTTEPFGLSVQATVGKTGT